MSYVRMLRTKVTFHLVLALRLTSTIPTVASTDDREEFALVCIQASSEEFVVVITVFEDTIKTREALPDARTMAKFIPNSVLI